MRDNGTMGGEYPTYRRKLLAFESNELPQGGLIVARPRDVTHEQRRQMALSIPESIRDLGEPLEPFFDACGGRQTISLAVSRADGRSPSETFVFQQPFVLIGRCRESDLALVGGLVEFRHLYLQLVAGRWMYVDLRKAAWDTSEVCPWGWFDGEHALTVGRYRIARVGDSPRGWVEQPNREQEASSGNLPAAELEFLVKQGSMAENRRWKIETPVSLAGSSRQCHLSLRDESVSQIHASFVLTPHGLWVVDLLGRGSVVVNGRPAYWRQLHDGSLLEIGRYSFRVNIGGRRSERPDQIFEPSAAHTSAPVRSEPGSATGMSEGSVADLIRHMTETQSRFFEQMSDMQTMFLEHSRSQMHFLLQILAHFRQSQQESVRQDMARIEKITSELDDLKSQLARLPTPTRGTVRVRKSRKRPRPAQPGPKVSEQRILRSDNPALNDADTNSPAHSGDTIGLDESERSLSTTGGANPTPDIEFEESPGRANEAAAVPVPPVPLGDESRQINADSSGHETLPPPPSLEEFVEEEFLAGDGVDVGETVSMRGSAELADDNESAPADCSDVHARLTERMARLAQERNATWRRILAAFTGKSRRPGG